MTHLTNLVEFPALGLSFPLNRVAFSIGGINIYWYGVCIAAGMCLALVFAFRHGVEFGVDADAMVDVILIGVVMGILCARLYYVAMAPYNYDSLWEVLAIRDGGLAIYGGIIAEVLLTKKYKGKPLMVPLALTTENRTLAAKAKKADPAFRLEPEELAASSPRALFVERTEAYNKTVKEQLTSAS